MCVPLWRRRGRSGGGRERRRGHGDHGLRLEGRIGTSSRVLPQSLGGWTVGALVQTNFGACSRWTACRSGRSSAGTPFATISRDRRAAPDLAGPRRRLVHDRAGDGRAALLAQPGAAGRAGRPGARPHGLLPEQRLRRFRDRLFDAQSSPLRAETATRRSRRSTTTP